MHYIKCKNCGHNNEVKTEYLTFCTKCNKKLDDNFADWSRLNSDKTFDDFKLMVCTTEETHKHTLKTGFAKRKGLKYWIGFAVTFAIFYALGQFSGEIFGGFGKKQTFDKVLLESANEINKICPLMVDGETRLDNAIAKPDNVFQYNYTLVNMLKDSLDVEKLKDYIEPVIINGVKTNPELKNFRENKTTLNYYYRDKAGIYLFMISVTPDMYE